MRSISLTLDQHWMASKAAHQVELGANSYTREGKMCAEHNLDPS